MPATIHTCTFCSDEVKGRALMKRETVYVIEDKYPLTQGHLLIIPFYHTLDYYTMTDEEHRDTKEVLKVLMEQILSNDPSVQGFDVCINCGEASGQSIQHAHIHLIPRREGSDYYNKPFTYLR